MVFVAINWTKDSLSCNVMSKAWSTNMLNYCCQPIAQIDVIRTQKLTAQLECFREFHLVSIYEHLTLVVICKTVEVDYQSLWRSQQLFGFCDLNFCDRDVVG